MSNQPQPTAAPSLWDRVLFTQHLEFTVDLSPEACFERLMGLTTLKEGVFNPSSITTRPVSPTEHRYECRVYMDRYGGGTRYSTAQFAGVIDVTDSGQTRVSGDLRASGLVVLTLVGLAIVFLITGVTYQTWVLLVLIAVIEVFYGLELRADYRKLRARIAGAFQPTA